MRLAAVNRLRAAAARPTQRKRRARHSGSHAPDTAASAPWPLVKSTRRERCSSYALCTPRAEGCKGREGGTVHAAPPPCLNFPPKGMPRASSMRVVRRWPPPARRPKAR
eukprot:6324299-Prymnesium_polylepis.1